MEVEREGVGKEEDIDLKIMREDTRETEGDVCFGWCECKKRVGRKMMKRRFFF